jgi:hypothetical protein
MKLLLLPLVEENDPCRCRPGLLQICIYILKESGCEVSLFFERGCYFLWPFGSGVFFVKEYQIQQRIG